jgi:hypothetical protein
VFVGHFALALAAKRVEPEVSLGWLMAAVSAADLIWPWLLLAGAERVAITPGVTAFTPLTFIAYPWSHSAVMLVLWGLALAGLGRWRGLPARACALLAVLVFSHWLLDVATHVPDMPLWPAASSPKLGLGLWRSIPATLAVEGAMWVAGLAVYLRGRHPIRWSGPLALWSFVAISTLMWAAGPWSPPPPDPRSLAWFALIGWVVLPWTAAADRAYR